MTMTEGSTAAAAAAPTSTITVNFYSDGFRLRGVLISPPGPGPHPALVYSHGWGGAVNDRVLPLMGLLAEAGYIGLAIDHRGFAGSEGTRARCDPFEQVRDVSHAVTYLGTREDVDADSIAVLGASFGGAIAIGAAAADDRLKAVVSMVGVGDAGRWLRDLHPFYAWYALQQRVRADAVARAKTGVGERVDFSVLLPGPFEIPPNDPTKVMYPEGYPLENIELAMRFRPESMIASISPRAVCLIGCADDTVVPASETESLYANAREPRQLAVFPVGNHGGPMGPLAGETAAVILAFLAEHMPATTNARRSSRVSNDPNDANDPTGSNKEKAR